MNSGQNIFLNRGLQKKEENDMKQSWSREEILDFIEKYTDEMLIVYYNPKCFTEEQIEVIKKTHNVYDVYSSECVPEEKLFVMPYKNVKLKPIKFVGAGPELNIDDMISSLRTLTYGVWNITGKENEDDQ